MTQLSEDAEVPQVQLGATVGAPSLTWLERNLPWCGVSADLLAVGSSLINLTPVNGRPAAFIVCGAVGSLMAIGWLIKSRKRPRKPAVSRIIIAWVALAMGVALVLTGTFFEDLAKKVGPSDVLGLSVGGGRITNPARGAIVQWCNRVEWVGSPPSGYVFRLAVAPEPNRVWVTREPKSPPPDADYDHYAWALYVGSKGDVNTWFEIRLYVVPEDKVDEYDRTRKDPHTADALNDDGLVMVHSIKVRRAPDEVKSCSSPDEGITVVR